MPIYLPICILSYNQTLAYTTKINFFPLHFNNFLEENLSKSPSFSQLLPVVIPSWYLVEWAIALHGMYELALVFILILKEKNLHIVGCVQCIRDITAYLLLPELKYYYDK